VKSCTFSCEELVIICAMFLRILESLVKVNSQELFAKMQNDFLDFVTWDNLSLGNVAVLNLTKFINL